MGACLSRKPSTRRKKAAASSLGLAAPDTANVDARDLETLSGAIAEAGGAVLARYRDPVGGKPLIFASLPVDRVEPTPYQRDASDTHVKRLMAVVEKIGLFLDPIIVVDADGSTGRRTEITACRRCGSWASRRDRARRARRRHRVQDPGAQHREGAQPAGEIARDHPHGARARDAGKQAEESSPSSSSSRRSSRSASATRAAALERRRVSVDPQTR